EMLQAETNAETSEHIGLIIKSVDEAARIIRQLLELSKPASKSMQVLDLRTVAEETLAILRFQLREAGCSVQTLIPASPVPVVGDAGQLKQVALNLAINALHAMRDRPGPVLTVQIRTSGQSAELVVSDNGCGIAPENIGRIFDPFFTTKAPEQGTGLGLSVCYSIVRQHSGNISVESEPGKGTRFVVSLRLEPAVAAHGDVDRPEAAVVFPASHGGARVLVVEDEIVLRRLLQEILCSRFHCKVDVAANGIEALEALKRGSFDMVLADIRMPIMNGTELYLHLRELRPELAKRFVFVTGHPGEKQLEMEIARWNVPVIAKPFTLARLAEVCGPYLQDPRAVETCA